MKRKKETKVENGNKFVRYEGDDVWLEVAK